MDCLLSHTQSASSNSKLRKQVNYLMTDYRHDLKVIGVGFSKTGTSSLQTVLDDLGFGPCYHGKTVYDVNNMKHLNFWEQIEDIVEPEDVNWNKIFYKYDNDCVPIIYNSVVDWPCAHYWRSLIKYYPNSKVILTTRDPNKWYKSIKILQVNKWSDFSRNLLKILTFILVNILKDEWWQRKDIWRNNTFCKQFGGLKHFCDDKENAITIYNDHISNIKRFVNKDRLFIIDWERKDKQKMYDELCRFLQVENKDNGNFPHLNKQKQEVSFLIKHRIHRIYKNKRMRIFTAVLGMFIIVRFMKK